MDPRSAWVSGPAQVADHAVFEPGAGRASAKSVGEVGLARCSSASSAAARVRTRRGGRRNGHGRRRSNRRRARRHLLCGSRGDRFRCVITFSRSRIPAKHAKHAKGRKLNRSLSFFLAFLASLALLAVQFVLISPNSGAQHRHPAVQQAAERAVGQGQLPADRLRSPPRRGTGASGPADTRSAGSGARRASAAAPRCAGPTRSASARSSARRYVASPSRRCSPAPRFLRDSRRWASIVAVCRIDISQGRKPDASVTWRIDRQAVSSVSCTRSSARCVSPVSR